MAVLHGCQVGAASLVGIQAVVLNGAVIGNRCLVGACALVPQGKVVKDSSLIIGSPAKALRTLSDEEAAFIARNAREYRERAQRYRHELRRLGQNVRVNASASL